MGKRKEGLSMEEHIELGRALSDIQDRLTKIQVLIGNRYSQKRNWRAMAQLSKAHGGIAQARSNLEDLLWVDFKDTQSKNRLLRIYYPHNLEAGIIPTIEKN